MFNTAVVAFPEQADCMILYPQILRCFLYFYTMDNIPPDGVCCEAVGFQGKI